ncbi:hypothetical protein HMPREF1572_00408 [Gardnerella vaginalis JCP7275]|uniref:Uncharacterized protein n=1 Tax=Gardnerella vaginalis JCP8108 TaxID=1261066 RepID=S4GQV4_GARVA|nr:hypothetical protein HMPREF1581_00586 [Gardnerella vaginalis JCP8108]EPI57558.1 hypothetical protein HMPREF1572_00408 [Gardnerella vaginalis JCP7275]
MFICDLSVRHAEMPENTVILLFLLNKHDILEHGSTKRTFNEPCK